MGLGQLAHVSLAEARRKASEAREIIHRGGDPFTEMADRQKVPKPIMFGEFADEDIEQAVQDGKWRSEKTEADWRNTITVHAMTLRKTPVAEVATDDVVRCLRPIWNSKHETATKVRERVKMVLDAAKVRGLRTGDNPAQWEGDLNQILSLPAKGGGHHASMPYSDLPEFMPNLAAVEGFGATALELAILTAARSGEVRGATWSEIDFDRALWIIPKERMKAEREHRIPLSDAAVAILQDIKAKRFNDLVFPGIRKGMPLKRHDTCQGAEGF